MVIEKALNISTHKLSADPAGISVVRARFIEFLLSLGLDDSEKEGWKLIFSEAANNAIEHGSKNDPSKEVSIHWWMNDNSVWLETRDAGQGPAQEKTIDPQLPDDPLAEGGRGLFIINNFADSFQHWRSELGYIARIGKKYPRLNNVVPANPEMDAILDELADCYESLSLYDRMTETLISDERVDRFIASSLELFMDSRDYDEIDIEIRSPEDAVEYGWITELDSYTTFGALVREHWKSLEEEESLSWNSSENSPFTSEEFSSGGVVPIYVKDDAIGLIATAYTDNERSFRSNDLRNLRAVADIIGTALSRALMQRDHDERKRLATEINIATKLQHQLLPIDKPPPSIPNYDLMVRSKSALEIAGDFVEVIQSRDGDYVGCVIDVMGKGVSAAILAGIFRSQFLAYAHRGGKLSTFVEDLNKALEYQLGEATMFITTFAFKLDHATHELDYVAAGHPPALLLRKSGETEHLISDGPPIGLFGDIPYPGNRVKLLPEDRLIVVTDGLYEWSTSPSEIYGWEPMVEWFESNRDKTPTCMWKELQQLIVDSRKNQNIDQEDDETILILTRN